MSTGSAPFKPYGNGGIGSGKMPGFANMLTKNADREDRELRALLPRHVDVPRRVEPVCDTDSGTAVPPTTTTDGKAKG